MQIMPSGGAWTNPAALNQQALGDTKHANTLKNISLETETVNPLEQSEKTSDRDANERYDGPPHPGKPSDSDANNANSENASMLLLPADDDLDSATLDLLG